MTSNSTSISCGTRVDIEERGGYRYQNIHASSHNSGEHGRFLTSLVSSRHVDENIHEIDKGDISYDDDYGRRNRISYDGDLMEEIIINDGRRGSTSK